MKKYIYLLILCILCAGSPLWAYRVDFPDLVFTEKSFSKIGYVINDSSQYQAFDIEMKQRRYTEDGVEKLTDEDDNFIVVPSQALIEPGKSQAVTISWVGKIPVEGDKEQSFRLLVQQLDIAEALENEVFDLHEPKKDEFRAQLTFLINYSRSSYVKYSKSQPKLEGTLKYYPENKALPLQFSIENTGTEHLYIKNKVKVQLINHPDLKKPELEFDASGINLLAGSKRVLYLEWPTALPKDQVYKFVVK